MPSPIFFIDDLIIDDPACVHLVLRAKNYAHQDYAIHSIAIQKLTPSGQPITTNYMSHFGLDAEKLGQITSKAITAAKTNIILRCSDKCPEAGVYQVSVGIGKKGENSPCSIQNVLAKITLLHTTPEAHQPNHRKEPKEESTASPTRSGDSTQQETAKFALKAIEITPKSSKNIILECSGDPMGYFIKSILITHPDKSTNTNYRSKFGFNPEMMKSIKQKPLTKDGMELILQSDESVKTGTYTFTVHVGKKGKGSKNTQQSVSACMSVTNHLIS